MLKQTSPRRRVVLLALLVVAGVLVLVWRPVGIAVLLEWGDRLAGHPAALPAVAAAQALLFTFALPGSTLVWVVAPFHPPLVAVPVLVAGSTAGALGARLFADRLAGDWQPGEKARSVVRILEERGGVFTQIALRALPGFPHSVINYAGGLLNLPLPGYVAAAIIGLGCKWWVYAGAIHGISNAARGEDAASAASLLPLFILAGLMVAAAVVRARFRRSG